MPAAERARASTAEATLAVVAGLALLLVRPAVAAAPGRGAIVVAILIALMAMSLAAPVAPLLRSSDSFIAPALALTIGLAAVVGAVLLPGARIPLPATGAAVLADSLAAVAEEAFFRRLVYGRLASMGPALAIAGSALLFALVHVPIYGVAVFWVDLGAGLLFGWQRWACGRWDVPAATHVAANLLAVMR
jgi:membrane protease YdiL (CAAX protease family)